MCGQTIQCLKTNGEIKPRVIFLLSLGFRSTSLDNNGNIDSNVTEGPAISQNSCVNNQRALDLDLI